METVARASSMLEASRDLTLDAVQAAAARTFGSSASKEVSVSQVRKLLDSKFDQEIHEGLRKVVNMMYKGQQCLPLFSAVIKNVASPNVEIKKLVYIYLLKYAEQEQDLALLSINTIHKSLSDQDPQVRAMALRVMSSIQVSIINPIVSLAIKKGCGDMSATVRKAAALAIPKCYRLEVNTEAQMIEYISILLGDRQYFVVGAAATAFLEVCPDRIDLLHKHYRGLVKKLVDMDEWGQLALIRLLTIYARKCFPNPASTKKSFKAESDDDTSNHSKSKMRIDADLKLFLNACKLLLSSRNPAVMVAVARSFLYVGTEEYLQLAIQPLISLLRGPKETHGVILYNIVSICIRYPSYFSLFVDHFWVWSSDDPIVRRLKMEILTLVFPFCEKGTKGLILQEFEHFTLSPDPEMVRESVRAIGRCAQNDSSTVVWCINLLLRQATSADDNLVGESLTVVRQLIQQDPVAYKNIIVRLAKNLDTIWNEQARATIVWLVGEYACGTGEQDSIAPDVLRLLAKNFAEEEDAVKSQITLLAAKVYLHHMNKTTPDREVPGRGDDTQEQEEDKADDEDTSQEEKSDDSGEDHPIAILWEYIQLLVRYDTSYELRDRMRLYKNLLSDPATLQLATLVLLAPKPAPQVLSPSQARKGFLLGSSALVVGVENLPGYEKLPDWVEPDQAPDPSLREVATDSQDGGTSAKVTAASMLDSALAEKDIETAAPRPKVVAKTLDDWLDEEGEEEDEEEAPLNKPARIGNHSESDDSGESDEDNEDDEDESESDDTGEGEEDDDDDDDDEESDDDGQEDSSDTGSEKAADR